MQNYGVLRKAHDDDVGYLMLGNAILFFSSLLLLLLLLLPPLLLVLYQPDQTKHEEITHTDVLTEVMRVYVCFRSENV